jgi:hypothetical protein
MDVNVEFTEEDLYLKQKSVIEAIEKKVRKSLQIVDKDKTEAKNKTELGFTDKLSI